MVAQLKASVNGWVVNGWSYKKIIHRTKIQLKVFLFLLQAFWIQNFYEASVQLDVFY